MVFFIRNEKNKSIAEIEVWQESSDVIYHRPTIYLDQYNLLIRKMYSSILEGGFTFKEVETCMHDFYLLSCMQGESTKMTYDESKHATRMFMDAIACKYNLKVVED